MPAGAAGTGAEGGLAPTVPGAVGAGGTGHVPQAPAGHGADGVAVNPTVAPGPHPLSGDGAARANPAFATGTTTPGVGLGGEVSTSARPAGSTGGTLTQARWQPRGPVTLTGAGWRIVPGEIFALLGGVSEEFEMLAQEVSGLINVAQLAGGPSSAGSSPRSAAGPALEDYHDRPEWGAPFGGLVAAALDEAIVAQTQKANQVAATISAAVVGVSQATAAYQAGNAEMAVTVQAEAAKAADTGNFGYFDYLREQ
ncbi:MAG: DUF6507 family protein [Micrococcales bacterium]|nr:DUF6507 family protein [Micrococcales bacterium]